LAPDGNRTAAKSLAPDYFMLENVLEI
jgi:hypothetical protein